MKNGYLAKKRIILIGDVLGKATGDIEDLFEVQEYLELYNKAFSSSVAQSQLNGSDAIVSRLARHMKVERFDHGRPADVLLRDREEVLQNLSEATFLRFEKLFETINKTI